jgi:hypothetical protein
MDANFNERRRRIGVRPDVDAREESRQRRCKTTRRRGG